MAHINQLHHKANGSSALKIALHQLTKPLFLCLRDLGVAVTGQIHKVHAVHIIEVDGHRLAGYGTDPGQGLAVKQAVKQ